MKTAFGFGGFAAKDEWKIFYSLKYLEMEGGANGRTSGGTTVSGNINFKISGAFVAGVYQFAKTGQNVWGALGSVRYLKHKFSNSLTVGASTGENNFSHSWTDAVNGLTNSYYFSEAWSWNTQVDAGYGGSNETYHGNTGPLWRFAESWVGRFKVDYTANDYENDDQGDPDWYLYKGRETVYGINVLILF